MSKTKERALEPLEVYDFKYGIGCYNRNNNNYCWKTLEWIVKDR